MKTKILLYLLLCGFGFNSSLAHNSQAEGVSGAFQKKIALLGADENNAVLNYRDQKVMMRALYAGISGPLSLAGVHIDSKTFYSKVGDLLVKGVKHGVLPSALTIGWYNRLDLLVGKTRGTELNFYLEEGKLRVSRYDIKTLNVGTSVSAKIGYYVSLCFGACIGEDVNGKYISVNADLVYGVGTSVYIEVAVDTTDYYKAKREAEIYALADMYECKSIIIGVALDVGLSLGFSGGFTDYHLTSDREIVDLYSILDKPNFTQNVANAFKRVDLFQKAPRLW